MIVRNVGFVGIGNMGTPMAAHLLKAGFDVVLFDLRKQVVMDFVARHGGKSADSLIELGRSCDAVITMLPDGSVVRRAVLGEDGADCLAQGLAADSVVIDMSTSDPALTVTLGERLAARGVRCLDAPVMGGVAFAQDGSLDIMIGGEAEIIERCHPLFDAMGRKVFLCGALGTAHAMKAILNYVNASALVTVIEALTVGAKYNIDMPVLVDAMRAMCNGRNHPLEKKVIPHVLTRSFASGMAMRLIAKDVGIATGLAKRTGIVLPMGDKCFDIWMDASNTLGGDKDQTCMARYYEERAGVLLQNPGVDTKAD